VAGAGGGVTTDSLSEADIRCRLHLQEPRRAGNQSGKGTREAVHPSGNSTLRWQLRLGGGTH
jgi:hypothetical protein